jgi:hypothetical protein
LQNFSLKKLASAETTLTPEMPQGSQRKAGYPKFSTPKGIDARVARTVQNPDALSQIMEQAFSRISDTVCRLGNHPL